MTQVDRRDPVRQFRGRLAAPVTVITAGAGSARTGLTVSSLMVAEGDAPRVHFLLGTTTDLYEVVEETRSFVVHVLEEPHRGLADRFAGLAPSPGGLFAGLAVDDGEYGPVIEELSSRIHCRYDGGPAGEFHVLAGGDIARVELHDLTSPLLYFRGSYRLLG